MVHKEFLNHKSATNLHLSWIFSIILYRAKTAFIGRVPSMAPHLLALPFAAQGHFNPMLELCNRLAISDGFFITFLVTVKRSDFNTTQLNSDSFRFVFLPEEFVCSTFSHTTSPMQFASIYQENLRSALPDIIQEITSNSSLPRLVCLLTDVAIVGLEKICSRFRLCKASLSTFPASWQSVQDGLELLRENNLLPLRAIGSEKLIDFIPGLPPIRGRDLPSQIQNDDPHDPGFKGRRERNETIRSGNSWVLLNSFHELESSQLEQLAKTESPKFVPVGPLLPPSAFAGADEASSQSHRCGFWNEDMSCMEWLEHQPDKSVIYVSVGSIAVLSSNQVIEILTGMKQSGKKFLWVMRSDTAAACRELDDIDDQYGKVVAWAPQLKVLKHPSVAAFLTHCGWNSMLEAVVTGTPVLCWPLLFDQPMNCALAVEYWKIGLKLPNPCSAAEVEELVQLITGNASFRDNVFKLSVAARNTVFDQEGTSRRNLQSFVDDMKRRAGSYK